MFKIVTISDRLAATYSWLEIYEDSSRNIVFVIGLIEEDVFAVSTLLLGCILFQCTILCDTMFAAEVLPEVRSDLVTVTSRSKGFMKRKRVSLTGDPGVNALVKVSGHTHPHWPA